MEGLNNKVKNTKRSGFGYRNFTQLRADLNQLLFGHH
ncbi:transposase [Alkalibacterium sp. f15]